MRTLFTLVLIIAIGPLLAQEEAADKQNIKVVTDGEPKYLKGEDNLYIDVLYNVKYPEDAVKNNLEGNVTLSFDVGVDSTISNCIVVSGIEEQLDKAVVDYVKSLKFIPGKQNGMLIKMNTMYTFPVKAH